MKKENIKISKRNGMRQTQNRGWIAGRRLYQLNYGGESQLAADGKKWRSGESWRARSQLKWTSV